MTASPQHLARLAEDLALVAEQAPSLARVAHVLGVDWRTISRTLARGRMSRYLARRWLDCPEYMGQATGLRRGAVEREARRQMDMMSGPAWR